MKQNKSLNSSKDIGFWPFFWPSQNVHVHVKLFDKAECWGQTLYEFEFLIVTKDLAYL